MARTVKVIKSMAQDEQNIENYSLILSDLYKFINSYGDFEYLPEVILEYCTRNSYEPEFIADVVSGDNSFKLALELNCIKQGTFREVKKSNHFVSLTDDLCEELD